ncbi:hypothetical protein BHM03_00033846 [Ensete ventricosum]|nr:hypothetical protein BHM03_00033846 [Ensete ventricosum]
MGSLLILSSMSLVILLLIWSYFQRVPLGDNPSTEASVSLLSATAKLYIVDLGERQYEDPQLVTASHHETLSSVLGSNNYICAVVLVSELPEVISVRPSRTFPLHTTRSWDYLGLRYSQQQPTGLLEKAKEGDGIIIGVVDTGN